MGDYSVDLTRDGVTVGKKIVTSFEGGLMDIGGDLNNKGTFKSWDAKVAVSGNLNNEGKFLINDPEKLKQVLIEISKTAKNATEIGVMVMERIFGKA